MKPQVTKPDVIKVEFDIVSTLQFDVQWAGPLISVERYLFALGYHKSANVLRLCEHICSISAMHQEIYLNLRPTEIAAISVSLVLNMLTSEKVCEILGSKKLRIQPPKDKWRPFDWWAPAICE